MDKKVEKFPLWGQLLYSSGNVGYTIADRIWVTFMLYFFLPPAESGMPNLISNEKFWGFLTIAGVVTLFGRVVDAIADPLVATWSDRSRAKRGRRKVFLIYGGFPLMAASFLLFFPPVYGESIINAVYMAFWLGVLLFFFTVYVTPWLALIPELSHNNKERMNIVTMQGAFSMVGVVIVMIGGFALWGVLENIGLEKVSAFHITILILAVIGLIFCYIAIIPINEERYCQSVPSDVGLIDSLVMTFKNWPFIPYLMGTVSMWFCLNIVSSMTAYYVTVLLGKTEAFTSVAFAGLFGVALIFFPVINLVSRVIRKKTIMIIALAIFGIFSSLLYFLGTDVLIVSPDIQAYIIFSIMGIPVSVLLMVPNAMISDLAEYDAINTGTKREAMYFGAQGLAQKINLGISTLVLGYLLTLGKDVANPIGVKLSGPVAGVICIIGLIMFIIYPEKKIYKVVEDNRKEDG
jgi:GPH family glycoside/pentoside/hexuronide:cation symporter